MNILYPYITQQVNTIAQQAGFGPVLLAPMNFDALYEQYQQRAKEKEAAVEK
jgi:preprotein translocase subunit SecB